LIIAGYPIYEICSLNSWAASNESRVVSIRRKQSTSEFCWRLSPEQ
jgi:hypothetical protein